METLKCWTDARTDAEVILYSAQCYALHWTDNKRLIDYLIHLQHIDTVTQLVTRIEARRSFLISDSHIGTDAFLTEVKKLTNYNNT